MSNESVNNYIEISTQELIDEELVPSEFDGTNIYGGSYIVAASASDATSLVITATSIPTGAGEKIEAKVAGNATSVVYDSTAEVLTVTY